MSFRLICQTGDAIIIRALVDGVAPSDLDIAITRDMVTIKGVREEYKKLTTTITTIANCSGARSPHTPLT